VAGTTVSGAVVATNGACREVSNEQLRTGDLSDALEQLWAQVKPELPQAKGAIAAAEYLAEMLEV
jgi:hypothetical protein